MNGPSIFNHQMYAWHVSYSNNLDKIARKKEAKIYLLHSEKKLTFCVLFILCVIRLHK